LSLAEKLKNANNELLKVQGLSVEYKTESDSVAAVDRVNLTMAGGESVGLVGESGCGKTTFALAILGLFASTPNVTVSGKVYFQGVNLLDISEDELGTIRGRDIGFAFQEPLLALNPLLTVGNQIAETLKRHRVVPSRKVRERTLGLLKEVDLSPAEFIFATYPHQLSGGMRQRAMLALALACHPQLLIADEPTSALDAPLRIQILTKLTALCKNDKISMLLITHNIAYARAFCNRLVVMYQSRLIEDAPVDIINKMAAHPYSLLLLKSSSELDINHSQILRESNEVVPVSQDGCTYYRHCERRISDCATKRPEMRELSPGHYVACWNPE